MTLFGTKARRRMLLAVLVAITASGVVRADPNDDLIVTKIPRDISSNSRIERIDVWGERIQAETLSPLAFVNISIKLDPSRGEGVCINCRARPEGEDDEKDDRQPIIDDLKQAGKIIWSVARRAKGGAVRFIFHSAPLGDYCADKPQDIACRRSVDETEKRESETGFGVKRHDLGPVIDSVEIERATLFGHSLSAVASAVFDQQIESDALRIDSYLQDDASGTLVLVLAVETPAANGARTTGISRPPPSPIRIDRDGRVFIEP
jgi:hypothetical protein